MNAIPMCFFCGLARATHDVDHSILGMKPACHDCDPNPSTCAQAADILDRMTGCLIGGVQTRIVDLGDERSVDACLIGGGFGLEAIGLYQERAVEAARRQTQRTAARFRPFEVGAEAAAFGLMIAAWVIGYVALVPPEPRNLPVHWQLVSR